jgi:sterol desaturase/sphingolipid hydroxylase (fatty acid hydroxylase superfamily)
MTRPSVEIGVPVARRESSRWAWLRPVVLPGIYASSLSAMLAVYVLERDDSPLATPLWIGAVLAEATALFGLEMVGARICAGLVPPDDAAFLASQEARVRGYAVSRRAYYLGQAAMCWFVTGIATVVLSAWLGAAARAHASVLQRAAAVVTGAHPALRIGVAFLLLDLWSYGRHRLEHARGETGVLYRWVHGWHHRPEAMDLYTGSQVHPLEAVLVFAVPCFVYAALGWQRWELLYLFTLFLVITAPQHQDSGFSAGPFGVVFHGPEVHNRHHSVRFEERNTNFADCLALWDRLFGTYVPPGHTPFRGPFGPGSPRASGLISSQSKSSAR